MLLEKAGWKIIKKEFWKNPSFKLGIRPFLRNFTNRYYAVYAERDKADHGQIRIHIQIIIEEY